MSAATVDEYLAKLPDDRREALQAIRKVILENLDKDYEEGIQYGMIGYYVPHRVFPPGYHCDPKQPLNFAGLASQKNHMSIYLMCVYGSPVQEKLFREAWEKTGKKLDMGKACVRFKKLSDIPLEVIGEAIKRVPAAKYIEAYQGMLSTTKSGKKTLEKDNAETPKKTATKKTAAKKTVKKTTK